MFSRLDPYFKATFRHAESTDTRQAIKRHDPGERKKKQEPEQEQSKDDTGQDHTNVSLPALITFLKTLVADTNNKAEQDQTKVSISPAVSDNPQSNAAMAASAYSKTARTTSPETQTPLADTNRESDSSMQDIQLSSEERRIIHVLIKDLESLSKKGVSELILLPDTSFLNSILSAVRRID
jgi:hypothetical protein